MRCALGTIAAQGGAAARPVRARRRRGVSLLAIFVSLLIVALGTIAVASTLVALRATEERNRAERNFAEASAAVASYPEMIATSTTLKGSSLKAARKELYQPAIDYYEKFVEKHANDPKALPQLAEAEFRLAGIYAKLGSKSAALALGKGTSFIGQLRQHHADLATYPSLEECALRHTMPTEWITLEKGESPDAAATQTYLQTLVTINFGAAIMAFDEVLQEHPEAVSARSDVAGMLALSGSVFGFLGLGSRGARDRSMNSWQRAGRELETLVRQQPNDASFKVRLAEAYNAMGTLQRTAGKLDEASASYQKAIEVREQIAAASPDDKTRQQELTTARRALERVKPAKKETADAASAATAEKPAATE